MKKLMKVAEDLGYEVRRMGKKGHPIWQHTVTGKLVTGAGTPSDRRTFNNILSRLRANAK